MRERNAYFGFTLVELPFDRLRAVSKGKGKDKGDAFTLVELLVVVSIIAVIVAMLLPALGRTMEQARRIQCLSQQKQIYLAALLYAHDYDDRLPGGYQDGYFNMNGEHNRGNAAFFLNKYLKVRFQTDDLRPSMIVTMQGSPDNNPVMCPSNRINRTVELPAFYTWRWRPDIYMRGFAPMHHTNVGVSIGHPRASRMFKPFRGASKAIIHDMVMYPTANTSFPGLGYYGRFSNHFGKGRPAGGNVIASDGSGRWLDFGDWVSDGIGWTLTPRGYWSQADGIGGAYLNGSGVRSLNLIDPAGNAIFNTLGSSGIMMMGYDYDPNGG